MNELYSIELVLFRNAVMDVRLLMDLYYDYFMKQNPKPLIPLNYTIVRAIEASFLVSDRQEIKAEIGTYIFCFKGDVNIQLRPHLHQWLSWRDKYIIDVIPLDGMFGISVPQAVIPNENMIRFNSHSGIYREDSSLQERKKLDNEVEILAEIFDELMSKAPS